MLLNHLKYGMKTYDLVDTPMVEKSKLDEDPQGKAVDPTRYCRMIGTLMYFTFSRPYLVFSLGMCARYHEKPTEKHLHEVKQIFRYLEGTINMGTMAESIEEQKHQQKLKDVALVPVYKHIQIPSSNLRIALESPQPKVIYKVCLEVLKKQSFFNAFILTADVHGGLVVMIGQDFQCYRSYREWLLAKMLTSLN
ncbi:hypothetical protein Tco_0710495 [Tanacetum coccineum]